MRFDLLGSRVRYLLLTRKEQNVPALGAKGKSFHAKWSTTIHTILQKRKLQRNPGFHQYKLNDLPKTRFRHELLWIPNRSVVDSTVPRNVPGLQRELIEGRRNPGAAYNPRDEQRV